MEINWDVIETENFIRSCERNEISQEVIDSLKIWAKSVRRQITPRNARPFISPNNIFEIWMAGIGDPDANKGKSGGYRFVYYIIIAESKLFIDIIEERKDLKFKGSGGKNQKKWDKHFVELKKELLKKYEN
jgi:mRNA-degrading endonuclease RelE of RelBE toxin-antitoxin system